jgi:intein/homing endonuclease
MEQNSSETVGKSPVDTSTKVEPPLRKLYFINEKVEWDLTQYIWTGCTRIELRDSIMSHAAELIRQIIRKQGLHTIYPGQEESAFGDLLQTAWCVVPGTMIFTERGLMPIEMLANHPEEGDISIKVFGKDGLHLAEYWARRPKTRTYKIKLAQHYNIEATGDHPLYVMGPDGPFFKNADKIEIGDLIAVQAGQQVFGNEDDVEYSPVKRATFDWWPDMFTEDLAYIIGLVISEGSIEKNRVIIYNTNQQVIDFLSANPAGLTFRYEGEGRNTCNRIRLVELFTQLGLPPGTTFKDKHIPDRLFRCSKKILVALLQGMFDGDGHSSEHNGEIGYSSGSPTLIEQLRILLLNFGIFTKTTIVDRGEVIGPKGWAHIASTAYQLKASTRDSRKFYDEIGFRIDYKLKKQDNLSCKPFQYMDMVSSQKMIEYIRKVYCGAYLPSPVLPKKLLSIIGVDKHLIIKKKRLTDNTFIKLVDDLAITDRFLLERRIEIGTIRWFPVSDISYGESETYDIRVKDVHNFTANGIITHNCQLERTLYKYRSRPHCRTCFNPDRPADSVLYMPDVREYGIIKINQVILNHPTCPHCNTKLESYPYILPRQGCFGGTETIIYRGMSKVFNMWSQISRTVILAYIKKEGRDRKNGHNYMNHLGTRQRNNNNIVDRFLQEARQLSQYSADHLSILDALEKIVMTDDRPHDGLIGKLVDESGLSRAIVTNFLKMVKLRSFEFTDSPLNRTYSEFKYDKRKNVVDDEDFG